MQGFDESGQKPHSWAKKANFWTKKGPEQARENDIYLSINKP